MQLSEFLKNPTPFAYQVIVDTPSFDPPEGTEEIGFLYLQGDDGRLAVDVLDTVIAYKLYGIKVFLEIPAECQVSEKEIAITAANLGIGLSVLPPKELTEESITAYGESLARYTAAWMTTPSAELSILPISAYFDYLVKSTLGHVPETITDDEYIRTLFVTPFTMEQMDMIKAMIRSEVFAHFGSEEEFVSYLHSIMIATTRPLPTYAELAALASTGECNAEEEAGCCCKTS